ncbi:MAG: M56 family metallopeptidase [bacterium]|nr:M56 family metallopeptidase [bacterium]
MGQIFLRVLNMSMTACWLMAAVIVLRFLLKKAPRWMACLLWAFVAFRLICPFQVESSFSLVPDGEPVRELRNPVRDVPESGPLPNGSADENVTVAADDMTFGDGQGSRPAGADSGERGSYAAAIGVIWLCGVAALLFYSVFSYVRLHKRTTVSVRLKGRIWQCDEIATPFILGIVRPHIYLPSDMEEAQAKYVIAHEQMHLQRRDHWWKPLGFLILSVHWFNPLCWVSYWLFCRDIELACDERVIRGEDEPYRKSYAEALVSCSTGQKKIMACPLAFGEVGVKERVKNVMNYKKPAFWIVLTAAAACLIVAVCFLTNPQKEVNAQQGAGGQSGNVGRTDNADDSGMLRVDDTVGDRDGSRAETGSDGQDDGADRGGNGADSIGTGTGSDGADGGADRGGSGADSIGTETGSDGQDGGADRGENGAPGMSGMQESDAPEIPDVVWEAARHYVSAAFDRTRESRESGIDWIASYVDWRIEDVAYCYTYDQIAGMTCDVYRLNYEFLAESPEDVLLVGGMSMSEDGWVVPESPNSDYLIFQKEGDTLTYFCGMAENDCEPGDELFTSDLINYCSEIGILR